MSNDTLWSLAINGLGDESPMVELQIIIAKMKAAAWHGVVNIGELMAIITGRLADYSDEISQKWAKITLELEQVEQDVSKLKNDIANMKKEVFGPDGKYDTKNGNVSVSSAKVFLADIQNLQKDLAKFQSMINGHAGKDNINFYGDDDLKGKLNQIVSSLNTNIDILLWSGQTAKPINGYKPRITPEDGKNKIGNWTDDPEMLAKLLTDMCLCDKDGNPVDQSGKTDMSNFSPFIDQFLNGGLSDYPSDGSPPTPGTGFNSSDEDFIFFKTEGERNLQDFQQKFMSLYQAGLDIVKTTNDGFSFMTNMEIPKG